MEKHSTINVWLSSLGLERHTDRFKNNNITKSQLPDIDDLHLLLMGIESVKERETILYSIIEQDANKEEIKITERIRRAVTSIAIILAGTFSLSIVLTISDVIVGFFPLVIQIIFAELPILIFLIVFCHPKNTILKNVYRYKWYILFAYMITSLIGFIGFGVILQV